LSALKVPAPSPAPGWYRPSAISSVDNLRVIHNINAGHLGRWSLLKAAVSLIWPLEVETAAHVLVAGIPEKLYERTDRLRWSATTVAIARVQCKTPLLSC